MGTMAFAWGTMALIRLGHDGVRLGHDGVIFAWGTNTKPG